MIFCLKGEVTYDVGSCHDSRTVRIEKWFDAPRYGWAIHEAEKALTEYRVKYKHLTDFGLSAELFTGDLNTKKLIKKIWEARWEDAQAYVPPRPAIPARQAGFRSKRFR